MATYFKLTAKGTCFGQSILASFYYAGVDGADVVTAVDAARQLAESWEAEVMPTYLFCLTDDYSISSVQVDVVDETSRVVGDFPVEIQVIGEGGSAGSTSTAATTAILAFRCSSLPAGAFGRTVKKSHLKVGPITTASSASDGLIGATFLGKMTSLGATIKNHSPIVGAGAQPLIPVRIGTPNAEGVPSGGAISDVVVRPYTSFLRSRLTRPSGV